MDAKDAQTTRSSRGRTGCLNCRKRRRKCDETKPSCTRCTKLRDDCHWPSGYNFRHDGLQAQHPSMVQALSQSKRRASELKIVGVEFEPNGRKRTRRSSTHAVSTSVPGAFAAELIPDTSFDAEQTQKRAPTCQQDPSNVPMSDQLRQHKATQVYKTADQLPPACVNATQDAPFSSAQTESDGREIGDDNNISLGSTALIGHHNHQRSESSGYENTSSFSPATANPTPERTRHATFSALDPALDDVADLADVDLDVLNYLASNPLNLDLRASSPWRWDGGERTNQALSPNVQGSVVASSPDMYFTYYPDVTYKELHSQLHDHMVKTAKNTALTRRGSLASVRESGFLDPPDLPKIQLNTPILTSSSPDTKFLLQNLPISQKRYVELWQNYLEEIALWLDMFDSERHFQTTVAAMAKRVDYLQFSILALSARQLERKNSSKTYTESLYFYQEAIKLIAIQLPTLSTEIIAACVLLCVLEMMSSSPRAWGKHLDGCAMLLEAAGVNGVVGGVRQAIFWCFARMDVWGGFLGDTITKIPTNRWFISSDSMSSAISQFKGKSGSDNYANYAVFLCASVVNVVSNKGVTRPHSDEDRPNTFVSRWKALYDLLENWYNDRTEDMMPLMNLPPPDEGSESPFNHILFSTPAGVNGNQLYHASVLLLLQDKPKEVRMSKPHKSMLWHARQLCGITVSNNNHGALINALQPLWIAGKLMSHRSQHVAILDALERLEKTTGWATSWRAQDLKEFWGVEVDL